MASWASARARARSIARSYHAPGAAPERRASRRASRGAGPMLTAVPMEHTDPAQLGFDPERLERVLGAIDADIAATRPRRATQSGRRLAPDAVFATMSVGKQF